MKMEDLRIYGVEDNYLNSKSKYKGLTLITTWLDLLPKTFNKDKYINTGKAYRFIYYFSTLEKAQEFANELWNKYQEKEINEQEYLKRNKKIYNTKIINAIRDLFPLGDEFSDEQIIASAEFDYYNLVGLRNNLKYNETYTPYEEDIQTIDHNLDYLEIFIKLLKGQE